MSDAMDRALLNEFIDWRERTLTGNRDVSPQRFLQERDWVDLEHRVEEALSILRPVYGAALNDCDTLGRADTEIGAAINALEGDDDWTEDLTIGGDTTVRRTNR